jgi:signal peptidase I
VSRNVMTMPGICHSRALGFPRAFRHMEFSQSSHCAEQVVARRNICQSRAGKSPGFAMNISSSPCAHSPRGTEWTTKALLSIGHILLVYVFPFLLQLTTFRYLLVQPSLATDRVTGIACRLGFTYPVATFVFGYVALASVGEYWWRYWVARCTKQTETVTVQGMVARQGEALRWLIAVATAAALATGLRSFLLEIHTVAGASMLPSLDDTDQIVVNKAAYGWRLNGARFGSQGAQPRYGDLIVFDFVDESGTRSRLLKRIIGLPGDRIKMHGGTPVINGWEVPTCDAGFYSNVAENRDISGRLVVEFLGEEWYLTVRTLPQSRPFHAEYRADEHEFFVLGDNRGESIDSRAWNTGLGGAVPLNAIVGRADWFLRGNTGSHWADFARAFHHPSREFRVAGVDTESLSRGIAVCLSNRPNDTRPPQPSDGAGG